MAPKWAAIRSPASGTALEIDSSTTLSMMIDARALHLRGQGREERLIRADAFLQIVQLGLRPSHLPDRDRRVGADELGEGGLVWPWIVRHEDRHDAAARLIDVQATRDVGVLPEVILQGSGDPLLAVRTTHDLVTLEGHHGHAEIHDGGRVGRDGADPGLVLAQAEFPADGDRLGDLRRAQDDRAPPSTGRPGLSAGPPRGMAVAPARRRRTRPRRRGGCPGADDGAAREGDDRGDGRAMPLGQLVAVSGSGAALITIPGRRYWAGRIAASCSE